MKRRTFKKNVNRFIKPLLVDLPRTKTRILEIKENDYFRIINIGHTIVNGVEVPEGCLIKHNHNTLKSIKDTAKTINNILNKYKYVFVRNEPELYYGKLYLRLITEGDK